MHMISRLNTVPLRLVAGWTFCFLVSAFFVIQSDACTHWFVVPVTLCGMLLVQDAWDWLEGRSDVFDPVGIIAFLGLFFFYISPILCVYWDSFLPYVQPPRNWRPWLGFMGMLNLIGLLVYQRIVHSKRDNSRNTLSTKWQLSHKRFWAVCIPALALTLLLQIYVYYRFGGIASYMAAYEMRHTRSSFQGMGWIFMISESFPILLFMAYAVASREFSLLKKWPLIIFALFVFLAIQMMFGGLRGSRSNTIWAMFWAAGIVHLTMRPLKRSIVISGLVVLITFMSFYGLYKSYGTKIFRMNNILSNYEKLADKSGRTWQRVLLGDLSRSDIQAFLLYRLSRSRKNYEYAYGRTYLNSLLFIVPRSIRPKLGQSKREAGTAALYGHFSLKRLSSRVYGLAGEAMLNFGIFVLPIIFYFFGIITVKARQFLRQLPGNDMRAMLAPLLVNLIFVILIGDSDNIIFFIIKNGSIPFLLIYLSSRRLGTLAPTRN